jgi:hypothetical protein
MWEAWRIYISFVLVGTIFILSQALSGGVPGNPVESVSSDPGDRSYREVPRDETSGRGGGVLSSDVRPLAPARRAPAPEEAQTD